MSLPITLLCSHVRFSAQGYSMIAGNSSKRDAHQTSVQTKKYRVMIVDDEQDITTIFKIGLEKE